MKLLKGIILTLAATLLLAGCSAPTNIVYFQNKHVDQPEAIDKYAGIVIQPNDVMSIVVTSRNPELVAMFNLPMVNYEVGSSNVDSGTLLGYVVDSDGYIEYPFLGPIKVAGLTRWELAELIQGKLVKGGYLSDAIVVVEFMNFKVSVLGEVNAPGVYNIDGDKVTILQALSLARDLTIYGMRENVTVIRERDGKRTMYEINLCDVSMFKSPAYYLQQNDVIYVEPSPVKASQSTVDAKTSWITGIALSSSSILISIATLIVNFIR